MFYSDAESTWFLFLIFRSLGFAIRTRNNKTQNKSSKQKLHKLMQSFIFPCWRERIACAYTE
ncbi:hypothetical protein NU08_2669 [Flavobacterium anhuiense]|uniref:Uncharacterized protein n=1 Tax=Flavobacterium anhuiense TaxID=459526 RepID=A0A444VXT4_9FLAO|nr:hypothetical protein NU08_2669 [Flavobacterium anhuiense]